MWSSNHKKNQQKQADSVWHHQTLNDIDVVHFSTYLCSSESASGFRPPLQLCCVICPWRFLCLQLCVRLIVASLHCWCCSARKTHPLLAPSLPLPVSDWLPSRASDITFFLLAPCLFFFTLLSSSPLFPSFSDHSFIVFILISTLHSTGARWNVSVIGRDCQNRRDSVRQRRDDMVKCRELFYSTIKGFLLLVWWARVIRMRTICYAN